MNEANIRTKLARKRHHRRARQKASDASRWGHGVHYRWRHEAWIALGCIGEPVGCFF